MGILPALFSTKAVFATIGTVETFVDQHYTQQINKLKTEKRLKDVRGVLDLVGSMKLITAMRRTNCGSLNQDIFCAPGAP